jgi:hypothetical protein
MDNNSVNLFLSHYTYDRDCVKITSNSIIRQTYMRVLITPRKLSSMCSFKISQILCQLVFHTQGLKMLNLKISRNFRVFVKYTGTCAKLNTDIKDILNDELISFEQGKKSQTLVHLGTIVGVLLGSSGQTCRNSGLHNSNLCT